MLFDGGYVYCFPQLFKVKSLFRGYIYSAVYIEYGITDYGVTSPGIQNYKDFCKKFNIPKGNY